ncbi:MAG: CDP-diacylglycerol--glycerol-3-phosphate 3-phosphatidyltransferase [Deltaproteobacteria bacterium]|nr:MAG: CDP-diacylglycerol--glycerol-3-phosphate 3-phosphatidyltransferase [Deltaproteobacteria bacterium]
MKGEPTRGISRVPNILTFVRVAIIPPVVILLYFPGRIPSLLAGICLALAFVTDILDGFFARRYESVTTFGKFLDPLADKILVTVTMIMLIPLERIPVWMVIVIVARELAVTGLRGAAVREGIVIAARSLGKYKTIFQSIALVGLCIHYTYFGINFHELGIIVLWVALVLTIWSGWDYFRQFSRRVFSPNGPDVRLP